MNDTQLRSRLQELADPPLAPRPSRTELEDRIARRARRRGFTIAAAAAFVLVAAGVLAGSGWLWTRAPGYVQVDDPTAAESEASQPSDKDPSKMTDAELAAELDRITRESWESPSGEGVADGVFYFFSLGAELLGGRGDPRGVDSWWSQQLYATPAEFAGAIDEYVADGLVRNENLGVPGYLEGEQRTVTLLQEVADRVRDMPAPERPTYESSIDEGRVPVPQMAGHGSQGLVEVASVGDVLVAVGRIGEREPGSRPVDRPAVLVSTDAGEGWELVDLNGTDMEDWTVSNVATAGDRFVLAGDVSAGSGQSRPAVAVSDDGRKWQVARFPSDVRGTVRDVVAAPDGTLVAVGWRLDPFGAAVWTSRDGAGFDAVDVPPDEGARISAVAHGPAGFVAVGAREDDGQPLIWRSAHGSEWQATDASQLGVSGTQLQLVNVEHLDGTYVITGGFDVPRIWQTDDPASWRPVTVETDDELLTALVFDAAFDDDGRLAATGMIRRSQGEQQPQPEPAHWAQDPTGTLRLVRQPESDGQIMSLVRTPRGMLGVGIVYPTDHPEGDGVVWDLPRPPWGNQ